MDQTTEVRVPDIGDFSNVPVVEISVTVGDRIDAGDVVIVLEGDKATMDVPAIVGGVVLEMHVSEGDIVNQDSLILTLAMSEDTQPIPATSEQAKPSPPPSKNKQAPDAPLDPNTESSSNSSLRTEHQANSESTNADNTLVYASPSVRSFARVLGVPINDVIGNGQKQRITKADVEAYVKATLSTGTATNKQGLSYGPLQSLPDWPSIDFSRFGPVERQPLNRISQIAGPALMRNALVIPHVTNFDNADITDLEAFRKQINTARNDDEAQLTVLAFAVRAVVCALQAYPRFNTSLDGKELIHKHYWHIGVAADTPDGLLVPVVKDADTKGLQEIASEIRQLAVSARAGKLKPADMQGATFTISSIGGIGGTQFTPIINAPEVAILGMSRAELQPVWNGEAFVPRLIQPLCLSWDHRVVNGAEAARFLNQVTTVLGDLPRLSL